MKLKLVRKELAKDYTIGDLFIDDVFFCNTLEHAVREVVEPQRTAIEYGTYKISIVYSPLNKCNVPLLQDVPHQRMIEIHTGNTTTDTKGCILVGNNSIKGMVMASRDVFKRLMATIEKEHNLSIEIINNSDTV
jgi:hypothetical protein